VTNFFEVVNDSATHIYHSALELSPLSSIVRKLYYSQRPHPSPRVVLGVPDSWDHSAVSVSTKESYFLPSTWSPCGRFVAAVTGGIVGIWDGLTLNVLSTLRSTELEDITRFWGGLAYSPDGRSLACFSNTTIVIWDTQTGGEVKKIEHGITGNALELVWSLDGTRVGTLSLPVSGTLTVCVYQVTSGVMQSPGTVQSIGGERLWAHDKSFRVMTVTWDHEGSTINIYEVGPVLTKVEQFTFQSHPPFGVFSPTTYRISVSVARDRNLYRELLILDVHSSELLLREKDYYQHVNFSPDGSLVAAFVGYQLHIWRFTSGRYTRWRELQQSPTPLQFSPTSTSILGRTGGLLHVWHLGYFPASLTGTATRRVPRDTYSPYGVYIVTTYRGESVITITNLCSQNHSPSQFIDTGFEISAIVLTGNVLLVKGSDVVVAWLLTEEGVVKGIFDERRADRSDSLWDMPSPPYAGGLKPHETEDGLGDGDFDNLEFSIKNEIGTVGQYMDRAVRVFHTRTGEILGLDKPPLGARYHFGGLCRVNRDLYRHDLPKHREPPELDWPVDRTALREGWVKDAEGKYRLWLHPRWREADDVDWLGQVTTLRLSRSAKTLVVKF